MKKKQIIFLGKTGSGKSSLINALFNTDFLTDNAVACTKKIQSVNNNSVNVYDTPGIAEDLAVEDKYFELYKKIITPESDIVWVFQADTRVYKIDQLAFMELREQNISFNNLFVALNQVDLIGNELWDLENNRPNKAQNLLVKEKIDDLEKKFTKVVSLKRENIVPVSAKYNYNLNTLKKMLS